MDRYRQIVELSDDCIKEIDLDGVVTAINDNGLRLFAASDASQMVGKIWADLWPEDARPIVNQALATAARGEKAIFEASGFDGQGVLRDWRVRVSALRDDHAIVGVLAVSSDITARNAALAAAEMLRATFDAKADLAGEKLAEAASREAELRDTLRSSESRLLATNRAYQELEVRHFQVTEGRNFAIAAQRAAEVLAEQAQKGEAVGQLLAGTVHDLNNLLQSATTGVELVLASGDLGEGSTRYLNMVDVALQQGVEMTRRLVGFARAHPYSPDSVDLAELIEKMSPLLRQAVGSAAELVVDTSDSSCCAVVDRNTLERALLNLVVNARDACVDGGTIRVTTGSVHVAEADSNASRAAGDYVTLSVSDTGIGMDEQTLSRMFEVYYTTKAVGKGSGLGLPQVHSAVRQAGGFITITSAPGEGACFELALPKVKGDGGVSPAALR